MNRQATITANRAQGGVTVTPRAYSARVTQGRTQRAGIDANIVPAVQQGHARRADMQVTTRSTVATQAISTTANRIVVMSENYVVENFTVTPQAIADRAVKLGFTPREPDNVELSIYSGVEQRSGVDFLVSGTSLSWDQLSLELLLSAGDSFTVRYVKEG